MLLLSALFINRRERKGRKGIYNENLAIFAVDAA